MEFTQTAIEELEATRVDFDRPMRINSGYRCPGHNAAVSSTGTAGPHTITVHDNVTVDVGVFGEDALRLVGVLIRRGWTGIGVEQRGPREGRFIHADRLLRAPRPWIWSY